MPCALIKQPAMLPPCARHSPAGPSKQTCIAADRGALTSSAQTRVSLTIKLRLLNPHLTVVVVALTVMLSEGANRPANRSPLGGGSNFGNAHVIPRQLLPSALFILLTTITVCAFILLLIVFALADRPQYLRQLRLAPDLTPSCSPSLAPSCCIGCHAAAADGLSARLLLRMQPRLGPLLASIMPLCARRVNNIQHQQLCSSIYRISAAYRLRVSSNRKIC